MRKEEKATLKIVIKGEWFDEILAKRKTIEYRDVSPFWVSRLYKADGKKRAYAFIEFINGYNKDARRLLTKFAGFSKRGNTFHIRIGTIVSKKL